MKILKIILSLATRILVIALIVFNFLYIPSIENVVAADSNTNTGNNSQPSNNQSLQQARDDYVKLFAPPDPKQNNSTWVVDIGPAANSSAMNRVMRSYADRRTPSGIKGTYTQRNVVWNQRIPNVSATAGWVSSSNASSSTDSNTTGGTGSNNSSSNTGNIDYGY